MEGNRRVMSLFATRVRFRVVKLGKEEAKLGLLAGSVDGLVTG
jgi:hypothetical protein